MPPSDQDTLSLENDIPPSFASRPSTTQPSTTKRTRTSRWRVTASQACFHILPVALTIAIISLNTANVRWRKFGAYQDTNELLTIFQVVAKVHEVLVVFSISRILLFWLTRWARKDEGMPLGLFAAAYHVAVGGNLLLKGVWRPLGLAIRRPRLLRLLALVLLSTLLALTSGPASAIALIPRLGWWSYGSLFTLEDASGQYHTAFDVYIPMDIAPTHITELTLPGSFCNDPSLDINGTCPYAGLDELVKLINGGSTSNISADADVELGRQIARRDGADSPNSNGISTSIWTSPRILSDYMSLGVDMAAVVSGMWTIEAKTGLSRSAPYSPIVDVICDIPQTPSANITRNLTFMLHYLMNPSPQMVTIQDEPDTTVEIDLRDSLNDSELANTSVPLVKFQDRVFGNRSTLTALLLTPHPDSEPLVQVCAIQAKYIRTSLYFLSTQTSTISSNFSWNIDMSPGGWISIYTGVDHIPKLPINITKPWAEVLNSPMTSSAPNADVNINSTGILANFIHQASQMQDSHSNTTSSLSRRQLIALASAFSSALSRIGTQHSISSPLGTTTTPYAQKSNKSILICNHHDYCSSGPFSTFSPLIMNGTRNDFITSNETWSDNSLLPIAESGDANGQILRTFRKPADVDGDGNGEGKWTRVSFEIKTYGYTWRFDTATCVAVAVLACHVLLVVVHMGCVIVVGEDDGRENEGIVGLVGLIGMVWRSAPPAVGENEGEDGDVEGEGEGGRGKIINGFKIIRRNRRTDNDELGRQNVVLRRRVRKNEFGESRRGGEVELSLTTSER